PQAIRIDILGGEWLAYQPVARGLIHPYSDAGAMGLPGLSIPCYDLREVLLEKLRGLAGQRRFAIARDLYDVHHLLRRGGLDVQQVLPFARDKFAARNVALSGTVLEALLAREDEFRLDWSRNVEKLVPSEGRTDFENAWTPAVRAMAALVNAAGGGEQ
ncbi:MAG: nucleotidyl transferase AbiEii/AbiGii toxin family protein, partial [Chloroflexi bacterium]|nr:nucleotidyl transferase AbiEii/AbiGii toxin family protein [Chloroflexota bacterium]